MQKRLIAHRCFDIFHYLRLQIFITLITEWHSEREKSFAIPSLSCLTCAFFNHNAYETLFEIIIFEKKNFFFVFFLNNSRTFFEIVKRHLSTVAVSSKQIYSQIVWNNLLKKNLLIKLPDGSLPFKETSCITSHITSLKIEETDLQIRIIINEIKKLSIYPSNWISQMNQNWWVI